MSERKFIKPVDWIWVQDTYGFAVIIKIIDKGTLTAIDLYNYDFYVNVRRGDNPRNLYRSECRVIDYEEKKIEYIVKKGELNLGDEFYYLEVQGFLKDIVPDDNIDDERKISTQDVLKVYVRRKKEE